MTELLAMGFIRDALVACLLIGLMLSVMGVYVVLRRIVFVGAALAQTSGAEPGRAVATFGIDGSHGWERIHWNALESLARLVTVYMQSGPLFQRDQDDIGPRAGFPMQAG